MDNAADGDALGRRRFPEKSPSEARIQEEPVFKNLVFPEGLDAALLPGIHTVLRRVSNQGHQQALLDELHGQLRIPGKVISNPAGYLWTLYQRVGVEVMALPLAQSVARDRERREFVKQRVAVAASGAVTKPASEPVPVDTEIGKQARAELQRLRNEFVLKAGKR